jgi:hypothetical protein
VFFAPQAVKKYCRLFATLLFLLLLEPPSCAKGGFNFEAANKIPFQLLYAIWFHSVFAGMNQCTKHHHPYLIGKHATM